MNVVAFHFHSSIMLSKHKVLSLIWKNHKSDQISRHFSKRTGNAKLMECQEWIPRSPALYSNSSKFHSRAGDQLQRLCFFYSFSSVHPEICWNNDFRYRTTASSSVFPISSFKLSAILRYTLIPYHIRTRSIGYTEKDTRIASSLKHVRPTAVKHLSEISMQIILQFVFYVTSRLQLTSRL
jgi:hypothetical protein